MFKLSVGDTINNAWEYALDNWFKLTMLNVAYVVIALSINVSMLPSGFFDTYMSAIQGNQRALVEITQMVNESNSFWKGLISLFVESIATSLLLTIYLAIVRGNGNNGIISSIKSSSDSLVKCAGLVFALLLISSLCAKLASGLPTIAIIAICLVLAFLFLRCSMACLAIIDEPDNTLGDALKASWEMTSGNIGALIILALAAILITFIGIIACCIGVFFTNVITYFMFTTAYVALADKKNPTIFDKEA